MESFIINVMNSYGYIGICLLIIVGAFASNQINLIIGIIDKISYIILFIIIIVIIIIGYKMFKKRK